MTYNPMKINRTATVIMLGLAMFGCASNRDSITILHFSDYHSSALPSVDEQGNERAGIARAIGYMRQQQHPSTLMMIGGDMMNKGAPAWSDKYRCAEWSWLNGLVGAMALGNHDSDYGPEVLAACRSQIDYPILSANTLTNQGVAAFTVGGKRYIVLQAGNYRVGVFALAGPDFPALLKSDTLPVPAVQFANRATVAEQIVAELRQRQKVDLVVLIGHAHFEDDLALAGQVAGIDLVLGSHSHRIEPLFRIPNTQTWYSSAGQYLSHINRVEVELSKSHKPTFSGTLVEMNADIPVAQDIRVRVSAMQSALESDPQYASQFEVLGAMPSALSAPRNFTQNSSLGSFVTDRVRRETQADIVVLTSSTLRKDLPKGIIKQHHLIDALPYDNALYRYHLTGAQVRRVLEYSASRAGSDFFSQVSGVELTMNDGALADLWLITDGQHQPLQDEAIYTLVTSDFQSQFAAGYKAIFQPYPFEQQPKSLREVVREAIQSATPTSIQ